MERKGRVCGMQKTDPPLRDVFAAQWLIAVLIGLLFCGMQLFVPDVCAAMLDALWRMAEESPALTDLPAFLLHLWHLQG